MDRMLAVIADNPVATAAGLAGMVCLAVWPLSMWPDNETDRDFLNFSGVADVVVEIIVQARGRRSLSVCPGPGVSARRRWSSSRRRPLALRPKKSRSTIK
jgi:hypothetical protein